MIVKTLCFRHKITVLPLGYKNMIRYYQYGIVMCICQLCGIPLTPLGDLIRAFMLYPAIFAAASSPDSVARGINTNPIAWLKTIVGEYI